jgi:ATP-binding cassette subfamily B protein
MAGSIGRGKAWNFISDLARASGLVWKAHPGYTFLVAILTVVQGGLPTVQLWISKLLIDAAAVAIQAGASSSQESLMRLLGLVGMQAGLFFLGSLLSTVQDTARPLLGELLSNQVNLQILCKTNGLEVAFFENEQFYNKLQNAYGEASYRPLEIVSQLFFLARTVVTLSTVILLLLRLHWAILPLILITTLPILLVQSRYGYQNYWMLRERAPELRKQHYFGMLLTSDWFIKEIRVFHLESHLLSLYQSLFGKFFSENRRLIVKRNVSSVIASAGSFLGWFLAAGYVAFRVAQRTITIGDFALYTQAVSVTQGSIQSLLDGLSGLYSNTLFLRNLFEFLSLPARDLSAGKQWTEPIEEIEFRNVSFCYPETDRTVLHNLSFKIGRGQSLALVGKNGAGKTTIAKLMCRLYEPTSGKILINGRDTADCSPQSIQEQIAVLFQDYGHYYLTARENIGVGRTSSSTVPAAVEAAAQRSGADTFIEALPHKYETMLGKWFDDGIQLSGGEWQKVALARAFLRKGSILILDEPTASLDAEAEYEIFRDLARNSLDQITLLISHRFSTVRMADNILVLEEGKCIETGSHEELMMMDGHYAYLFKLQARGYELDVPPIGAAIFDDIVGELPSEH